jgi:hypothetical protein
VPWVKRYPVRNGSPVKIMSIKSDILALIRSFFVRIWRMIKKTHAIRTNRVMVSAHSSGSGVQYHSNRDSSHM